MSVKSGETYLANTLTGFASSSGGAVYLNGSGAGIATATHSGTVVDTRGWSGVVFTVVIHNACATSCAAYWVCGGHTQASAAANDMSGNLSGTQVEIDESLNDSSGRLVQIEIHNPIQRFLKLYMGGNTSGSKWTALWTLYGPTGFASNNLPVVTTRDEGALSVTTASGGQYEGYIHISPAKGTK